MYPVKPEKLGWVRAKVSVPGSNKTSIRNTVGHHTVGTLLAVQHLLVLAHSSLKHNAPSLELGGLDGELTQNPYYRQMSTYVYKILSTNLNICAI